MPNLLEIDSVVKSYDNKQVLTDIYLKCSTSEIIGLLGRNGTGKSTLLKILFGTLQADSKFIRIDGKVYNQAFKAINEICYLPQDSFLPKEFSVIKIVKLYLNKSQTNNFFKDSILSELVKSKISNLSGGELRYLEIKLLLSLPSKFILLDEPFNGVSPMLIDSIKCLITQKSKTCGIILTDHDYRNVMDVSTRFCLLFDGGIKHVANKSELEKWGYIPVSNLQ